MGMNILIAHGGGPTAVINSSLQGVIETARSSGKVDRIYAAHFGVEGILNDDLIDLTNLAPAAVAQLSHTPASAIGSCRRKLDAPDMDRIVQCFRKYRINGFLYNGGNDSMDTCLKISQLARREHMDLSVIGIPKTMDNDLVVTDHCPGFGSAARYAAISASELALEASALPIHVIVLELMGRNAGWVTAAAAYASRLTSCPVQTYLPELPVDEDALLASIETGFAAGKGLLVAVSEGVRTKGDRLLADTGIVDGFGHVMPGGAAQHISDLIVNRLHLKARAEKPGLLGRCSISCSSSLDREEARAVGKYAVEALVRGETGGMVAIDAHRLPTYGFRLFLTPLSGVANIEKKFPLEWLQEGNGVAPEFFDYVRPLLGGPLPEYVKLV